MFVFVDPHSIHFHSSGEAAVQYSVAVADELFSSARHAYSLGAAFTVIREKIKRIVTTTASSQPKLRSLVVVGGVGLKVFLEYPPSLYQPTTFPIYR